MSPELILAIDQGTTNTKAIIVDREGKVLAKASLPSRVEFPRPGWVEQDALQLWNNVETVMDDCLSQIGTEKPTAIGISNQRETILAWDRSTGLPLAPAIVWQCRRSADICRRLREDGLEPVLRERTGLTIDPLFSASKMRWLLSDLQTKGTVISPEAICFGTVDSWLTWRLTGGRVYVTDVSNAARTQLYNLKESQWDRELLDIFGVSEKSLPKICRSSEIVGQSVELKRLPAGIPIASLIGDSHAALFGQGGYLPGSIKATYGTGTSLMMPLQAIKISEKGLSSTVAWGTETITYAFEGNISVTGAAVDWLGKILTVENGVERVAELAAQVASTEGVYIVPSFVGLGAPHWDEEARGMICGMTRGTGPKQLAKAVLDSIAYQVRDVFDAMQQEAGSELKALLADGGATRNDQLMQFQADLLGCAVLRNTSTDVSALGAAYLAGLATGVWSTLDELAKLPHTFDRFEPGMAETERNTLYQGWQAAVARARFRPSQ